MKLWKIKAEALRLMFADTDIEFSLEEFTSRTIYENSNTREKLVSMDESIKRAIDVYYNFVGEKSGIADFVLKTTEAEDIITYYNEIDLSTNVLIGYPTRVDVYFYTTSEEVQTLNLIKEAVDFTFDEISNKIIFLDVNYSYYEADVKFKVYYKMKKLNLPDDAAELTYDLNELYIPEEVQRKIPLFVKGELYEEDESGMAAQAANQYLQFLTTVRKPFSKVQTKVKRAKVFSK